MKNKNVVVLMVMIMVFLLTNYQNAWASITISVVNLKFNQKEAVIGDNVEFQATVNGIEDVKITELLFQNSKNASETVKVDEIYRDDQKISVKVRFPSEGEWYLKRLTYNAEGQKRYKNIDSKKTVITIYDSASKLKDSFVTGITYQKKEVKVTEKNVVYVNIDKKMSGIKKVGVTIGNDKNAQIIANVSTCKATVTSGRYSCSITLPKNAPSGEWKITNLYVATKNELVAYTLKDNAIMSVWPSFQVINKPEDLGAPKIQYDKVLTKQTKVGQWIKVEIGTTDDQSFIKEISATFENKKTKRQMVFNDFKRVRSNVYQSSQKIPLSGTGEWQIKTITVVDQSLNEIVRTFGTKSYTDKKINALLEKTTSTTASKTRTYFTALAK